MKYRELNQKEKDILVGSECFLNGKPARIHGRRLNFPIVAQIDGPLAIEYAWKTTQRILNRDGQFKA
jgi:hypothetical protein